MWGKPVNGIPYRISAGGRIHEIVNSFHLLVAGGDIAVVRYYQLHIVCYKDLSYFQPHYPLKIDTAFYPMNHLTTQMPANEVGVRQYYHELDLVSCKNISQLYDLWTGDFSVPVVELAYASDIQSPEDKI